MVYIKKFMLPSVQAELEVIKNEKRTCFHTFYPFKIFLDKQFRDMTFDTITLFYGGNGSGKSTLINVLAEKIRANRMADFNDSPFFGRFVSMCDAEYYRRPPSSYVLASDDVFDYALTARNINDNIDEKRNELFEKYVEVHREAQTNPDILSIHGIDDYERWKEVQYILSSRRSQSSYVRKNLPRDIDLCSNGETAMRYFLDRIDEDAVYLLDEPENSLSIEFQIELADYIAATAVATKSQFIIATHSPIFLSMRGAKIYNLDDNPVQTCKWTELPNVRKFYDFFMSHKHEFDV